MRRKFTDFKLVFVGLTAIFIFPIFAKAQIHLFLGQGIGMYKYYQGPLETRAFVFNNSTDVTKEMTPNRSFSGTTLGANLNLGRIVVGLDWAGKKNILNGISESGGNKITDKFTESLNTFYISFGMGNKAKKLTYRVQTGFGFYSFKLKEELKGTADDFNDVLGKAKGVSCRTGVNLWYPVYKKININILPYYEFDTGGGYVEVLQDKIKNSEFFNITTFGININIDYAF